VDCFSERSEGATAKVDFNSYLAVTLAHLGREGVRIKMAANPGPYAEQLPWVLGRVFPGTARKRSGGGQPQQEKAAREQQMATSGQELIPSEEKMTPAELQGGTSKSADRRGHWLGETKTTRDRPLHSDLEPKEETETPNRAKDGCRVARVLKAGSEFLVGYEVRQVLRSAGKQPEVP
jgi:hypothetical protein